MDRSLYLTRLREARQAGLITSAFASIGMELLRFANRAGSCWPSLVTLADGAGLSVRTASSAIIALRDIGALTWRRRPGRAGNRAASNVYSLAIPLKENLQNRSVAKFAYTPTPQIAGPALEAALARLGAVIGAPEGQYVMPWLAVRPDVTATCRHE